MQVKLRSVVTVFVVLWILVGAGHWQFQSQQWRELAELGRVAWDCCHSVYWHLCVVALLLWHLVGGLGKYGGQ